MKEFGRRLLALLILFAVSIMLALLTVFVASLPAYAAEEEIWQTQDGNVSLTPEAAKDLLLGMRTLRAENEALTASLESERKAAQELITAVQELRQEIQKERELSQQTIVLLEKQIAREKAKTRTVSIIGAAAVIAALIL